MRGISKEFIKDLISVDGKLNPFYKLKGDDKYNTLLWEIRADYLSIYYKGGRLFEIKKHPESYQVNWDINYTKIKELGKDIDHDLKKKIQDNSQIRETSDCEFWIDIVDELILAMEAKWDCYPKKEKFVQQVYALNCPVKGLEIIDFEYQIEGVSDENNAARFDLMGIRKVNGINYLSFIELKQDYKSVNSSNGASGLYKHYKDILTVVSSREILKQEIDQSKEIFNTKKQLSDSLGVFPQISQDRIEVLFVLANYVSGKNFSKNLLTEVEKIKADRPLNIEIDVRFQFLKVDYPTTTDAKISKVSDIIDIDSCVAKGEDFYSL